MCASQVNIRIPTTECNMLKRVKTNMKIEQSTRALTLSKNRNLQFENECDCNYLSV